MARTVALDTPIFIYVLEAHPEFGAPAKAILDQVNSGQLQAIASTLVLTELLTKPYSLDTKLAELMSDRMLAIQHCCYLAVDVVVGLQAARLRAIYGSKLRTADALHVATAIVGQADYFLTNDQQLVALGIQEIQIKALT